MEKESTTKMREALDELLAEYGDVSFFGAVIGGLTSMVEELLETDETKEESEIEDVLVRFHNSLENSKEKADEYTEVYWKGGR